MSEAGQGPAPERDERAAERPQQRQTAPPAGPAATGSPAAGAPRRFWLAGRRAAEQDRWFREALEARGWVPGDAEHWDTAWVTGMPEPAQRRRASPRRRLNHLPGNAALTVKSRLYANLAELRARTQRAWGAESDLARRLAFFPRAYVMPHEYHALQAAARAAPAQRWILKPTNASKGKGVRVLSDVAAAPLAPDWLVQTYLDNPHTLDGRKYVLRLYVLIASLDPLRVYLYRRGFAKLASERWDPDDADNPFSQLTNPDINARNGRVAAPVTFIELARYRRRLRAEGHDPERLFARLADLVALTVIAGRDAMRHRADREGVDPRGGYELLGLDCLVDADLKPWLLECNLSPSLGVCAGPTSGGWVEAAVKRRLVRDLVTLLDLDGASEAAATAPASVPEAARLAAEAERARAGDFQRLLPDPDPARYLPYLMLPSRADWRLVEGLAGRSLAPWCWRAGPVVELIEQSRLALYAPASGRYRCLNDSAALIWLLASAGHPGSAIVAALEEAARHGSAPPPDATDVAQQVWDTLGAWCRAGLLVPRESAAIEALNRPETPDSRDPSDGAAPEARDHATPDRPSEPPLALTWGERRWALWPGAAAVRERLATPLGRWLSPLAPGSAHTLPRLSVLQTATGYALATDDTLLATSLNLVQLAPALLGYLLRQAAQPGRPVLDAELWLAPDGRGVLCLRAAEAMGPVATPLAAGLSRGIGLSLGSDSSALPWVTPLGLPAGTGSAPSADLPPRVRLSAVLWEHAEPEAAPSPLDALEALAALLTRLWLAEGTAPAAALVEALGAWLARLDCRRVGPLSDPASVAATMAWLTAPCPGVPVRAAGD